ADDDGHLDAEPDDLAQLGRDAIEHGRIDPVALAPGQCLTRELEDDTAVGRAWRAGVRRHDYPASPTWKREKRRMTMRSCVCAFTPSTRSLIFVLPVASFTNGCSRRHCSLNHFSSLPSTKWFSEQCLLEQLFAELLRRGQAREVVQRAEPLLELALDDLVDHLRRLLLV